MYLHRFFCFWLTEMNQLGMRHNYVKRWITLRHTSRPPKLSSYSENQQKIILDFLNVANTELFQSCKVDTSCLPNLLEHRSRNGKFCTLSSLLDVNGLSEEAVQILCENILHISHQKKTELRPFNVKLTPELSTERLQKVNSILSVNINSQFISWACLDRNLILHSWEITVLDQELKNDLNACYETACDLFHRMPQADLFVMEKKGSQMRQNSPYFYIEITAYLKAFLTCLKNMSSDHPSVVMIKDNAVTKLFKLKIGGERVSGQDIVKSWLNGEDTSMGKLQVQDSVKHYYEKSISINREHLSNILLLGVAFLRLVLLREDN